MKKQLLESNLFLESDIEELKDKVEKEIVKDLKIATNKNLKKFKNLKLRKNPEVMKGLQNLEETIEKYKAKRTSIQKVAYIITRTMKLLTDFDAVCHIVKGPPNMAVMVPFDPNRKNTEVYVTTGALKHLTPKEFVAVLLHECGHLLYTLNVIATKRQLIEMLIATAIGAMSAFSIAKIYERLRAEKIRDLQFLYYMAIAFSIIIVSGKNRRRAERLSDAVAVRYGYGEYLASALKVVVYRKRQKKLNKPKIIHTAIKFFNIIFGSTYDTNEERICKIYAMTLSTLSENDRYYMAIKAKMRKDHCDRYL